MLVSILKFCFVLFLNYRLLSHDKINFGEFVFYFSRNLRRKKKKTSMIGFFIYYEKKSFIILFLACFELFSKIKKLIVRIS